MGLPAKRRTSRSKKERASHFALKKTTLSQCEKCGKKILPHHACVNCGTYRGKQVIKVEKRTSRQARRAKRTH